MISGKSRKIDVAGLQIDEITKKELLAEVAERIKHHEKTFVTTPYSEMLYASARDRKIRHLLNSADFAIADGVGILWAHLFLSVPLTWPGFYLKVIQAWLQMVWTGASILLRPKLLYKDIPEKIVGADLIWDLAKMAEQNNFSVFLLGSKGDVAKRASEKLKQKFPNLKISGTSNKGPKDLSVIEEINSSQADLIFVTYNRLVQEQWIADNLSKTNASFAIGLGGTFDYITGNKIQPPKFIRKMGLEWLYRLITQPSRVVRIFQGFAGLISAMIRIKIHNTFPLRKNACAVVINKNHEILLCQRVSNKWKANFVNYWQFPQGGIDEGEEVLQAATRELREETGITSTKILGQAKYKNIYIWDNALHQMVPSKEFRFQGQEQDTVFYQFIGDMSEIKLDMREFINYQWVPIDEVLNIIADERKEHAKAVLAELKEIQL